MAFVCLVLLSGPFVAHGQEPPQSVPPPFVPPTNTANPLRASAALAEPATKVGPPQNAPAVLPSAETASTLLPRELTPWGMFLSADIIVKAVMIGLALASLLTWTIWLAKSLELFGARRRLARAQCSLAAARSFAEVAGAVSAASPHVALLIRAAEGELRRSANVRDVGSTKERITARLERIEAGVGRQMMRATGVLATIGATAPFVGLFGTVWGIMNSFIGISQLRTTNLAVVAPGIAEALLATAFGLAAAIPAVVIYNAFARSIARYRALYADASVEILTLVSRDLSQQPGSREPRVSDSRRSLAAAPAAE
jgi:biopolymer transport protein ExbB